MKTAKMFTILVLRSDLLRRVALVLALGLMVCTAKVSEAAPMGMAFTYQGHLVDAGSPADGVYDFEFKLYDDPNIMVGNQVGWAIYKDNLDVIDGHVVVELDFFQISIFNGDALWLQVGVLPGDSDDTIQYTILVPRQELTPTPYALYAKSSGTVTVPLELIGSVASPGAVISGTNTGSGHGGNFKSTFGTGRGVYGWASNSGSYINYGGYFLAEGSVGQGVHGEAPGSSGTGVWGMAGNTGNYTNFGGFFEAAGTTARGVYGYATNTGNYTNYGGYFEAKGETGRGVYGEATDIGNGTNYGGYFVARSKYGRAVYGNGTGESGRGVWGETSGRFSVGVQGMASGENSFGVYGYASNSGDTINYGGYFAAAGLEGRAVYGKATNTDDEYTLVSNFGGYFEAAGIMGMGVYGVATGEGGFGVYGEHTASGNYGRLGSATRGVYGWSAGGNGVHGGSNSGYAGYFQGKVHITGTLSKGGGSFKIDHPLDPENKYLQHSFVESPDMMNVYNGNVLLDEKGEACVQLPEYFKALNRDFRYQLTAIGTPAPNLYIAEEISDNRFKIAGGKKGAKVSWQVTGIRQDAYAKANRIVVEENKPAEERGYYLHPTAYGLPEEKGIEAVHNARLPENRQVAKKTDWY